MILGRHQSAEIVVVGPQPSHLIVRVGEEGPKDEAPADWPSPFDSCATNCGGCGGEGAHKCVAVELQTACGVVVFPEEYVVPVWKLRIECIDLVSRENKNGPVPEGIVLVEDSLDHGVFPGARQVLTVLRVSSGYWTMDMDFDLGVALGPGLSHIHNAGKSHVIARRTI